MIILDNMTLQGAARALSRWQPDLWGTRSKKHRNADKWDYAYSDDLRMTADILALAQLVQSIVLYDEVGVGPYGTPSWAKTRPWLELEPPNELDGVAGLLTVLDRGYDHQSLITKTALRAQEHTRTEDFRDYIRTLEDQDALGAYLRISNGYFGTGFSDELLCGDSTDQTIFHLMDNAEKNTRNRAGILARLLTAGGRGWGKSTTKAARRERELDYQSDVDITLHPFDLTQVESGDFYEKVTAGLDLVRNIAATYYYDRLAAHAKSAYAPHPLRVRFVEYRAPDELSPADLVRRMEERRAGNVRSARQKIARTSCGGEDLVEVRLPLFLAAVLTESAEPEDVVAQALHLRDSPPARRLRAWFEETGELCRSGGLGIDQLTARVQELEKALDTWWSSGQRHDPKATIGKITIGLTAWPPAIQAQAQDVSLVLPRLGRRRPRTFRLLYDLAQISRDNLSLAPELGRVLGSDAADAWRRCAGIFEQIETGRTRNCQQESVDAD
ncbi:hypothetical protein [Amycolatopsis pigmentata]|uniref:Uncharacterized protein n=1 Tax=Amycolatopsis pigmentata TaxID=450801 RepID=A0ABW5G5X5_9PSEU